MYNSVLPNQNQLRFYVPESLDLGSVLPPEQLRYRDEIAWLIHTIYLRRILDRRGPTDHIPLMASILRRVLPFRGYATILKSLESAGILEIDPHYVVGEKSKGYRLRADLMREPHRRITIDNPVLAGKLAKIKDEQERKVKLDVHIHLRRHLRRLRIDPGLFDYRAEAQHSIDALSDGQFFFVPDEYGRVHTNLTNLASEYRRFLSVDGQRLVSFDVRNSQPLFAGVVLLNYFAHDGSLDSIHNFQLEAKDENGNQREGYGGNPHPYDVHVSRFGYLNLPGDLTYFIQLTEGGQLYEYLMTMLGIPCTKRDEFKEDFFGQVFYCRDHRLYHTGREFARMFPNVMEAVADLKRGDFRKFNYLLQRVESSTIINRVCRRMMEYDRDAFIGTIHDSVLTTPEHAGELESVLRSEFARVDIHPTIRREDYATASDLLLAA